jgi:hypothetical protein
VGLLVGLGAAAASMISAAQKSGEAQSLLKATCTALGPAVAYHGWDGDRHAFTFASRDFTDAFLSLNADEVRV